MSPEAPPWGITRRDLVLLAALLLAAVVAVPFDTDSAPGSFARVAMSWETVNQRALEQRTLPLWNPYEFGGRPHLVNPETLWLYPPHVLLRFLALPLPLFVAISFALHTWLAGAGTYLAARFLRFPWTASIAASAAVMCGGLFIRTDDAYMPDVYALAWLPLIAACALRSAGRPAWLPRPELVAVITLGLIASALRPSYALATVVGCYVFSAMFPSTSRMRSRLVAQPMIAGCLAVGLSAFQVVPTIRFWNTMRGADELLPRAPPRSLAEGWSAQHTQITSELRSLRPRGRVLSACDRAVDGSGLVALGLPGVGGDGGVFPADYARFSNLVRGAEHHGMSAVFEGIPEAALGPARVDLLRLLGVEYLVACAPVDLQRWAPMRESQGVGSYRSPAAMPRAWWTCTPRAVGRGELEHRLRRSSYDERLVLQPHVIVHIRWPAGFTDLDRARVESELNVAPHKDIGDRTWEYNLLDRSPENLRAIVLHPLVEDTSGIDRATFLLTASPVAVPPFDEPHSDWLLGADACEAPVPVALRELDRLDGTMRGAVYAPRDGIVFFSETYYPDRHAWIDGQRVDPMKVNLAFTAVPIPAGSHRIELRYDARALWVGAGLSVLTLVGWLAMEWRVRRWLGGAAKGSSR